MSASAAEQVLEAPRLLIVDDTEANRYQLSRVLRHAGFQITEAATGREGLEFAKDNPALIILDVNLPDMLGFTVCKKLKEDPATSSIPVLHLSASFIDSDHKVRGLETGADAYLDYSSPPSVIIATVRALLRLRKAEEAAKQALAEWRQTFDAIHDAVLIVGDDNRILRCNKAAIKLLSLPVDCIVGVNFVYLLRATLNARIDDQTLNFGEQKLLEINNGPSWFRITADPVPIQNGGSSGMVYLISDISEQKRSEAELREREERYRIMGETVPFGAWLADAAGNPVSFSPSFLELLGMTMTEVMDRGWMHKLPADDFDETLQHWLQCVRTGEEWEEEFRLRDSSGIVRTVLSRGCPVRNELGHILSWVGVNLDITTRKETERELMRANKSLEVFAYIASHDLRAPLRAVSGYVQMLQRRYDKALDEGALHCIHGAVQGVDQMNRLISDLLAFSHVQQEEMVTAPTSLDKVVERAVSLLAGEVKETDAQIQFDNLPTVKAKESLLIQLFQNLISNSLKFRGEENPLIKISGTKTEDNVRITVTDNGIGFEAKYAARIFEIFKRLHSTQKYPGTGIGLAICKQIVDRHGGTIDVKSETGKGTTFTILLPA